MIGMEDFELFGIELQEIQKIPVVGIKYSTITHKMQIPFIGSEISEENEIKENKEALSVTNLFALKHSQWRLKNYGSIKEMRSIKNPDFYYTDNILEDSQLNSRKKEHDKNVLNLMKEFIVIKKSEKVVDLFETLMLKKSKDIAIQLCEGMEKYDIVELLKNKLKLFSIIDSTYNLNIENNRNYLTNNNNNTFSNDEKKVNNNNGFSELSERAMKIESYKNLEEEIRNEMENYKEGDLVNEENENEINLPGKINGNFEKKFVNNYIFLFIYLE